MATRAERIARDIESGIISGEIALGVRLDETALATRYDVSRTPVREALQLLSASGMVRHIPRRGMFVRQPDAAEVLEMFEVMAEYEAFAGRLAAGRITTEALAILDAANMRCATAAETGDADLFYSENVVFHTTIYAEAGNSFLEDEARRLHTRLRPYRRSQLQLRGRMIESLDEHRAIAAHLRQGDGAAAADALRSHVGVQGDKFHLLLRTFRSA
ncbi:GntR family transcriptional regulator [Pontibaca salina]|uniref:GntR family transcriptional regulator n=1 Tax=Pontibaca salina TaxID=2795731 RepID=A0A934HPX3_9RHOB|nr:GntR family transcriptional regulator [Pontibaca salina]MBI6629552.1 GntR family transcriptional regulator [Pontibaca salina]